MRDDGDAPGGREETFETKSEAFAITGDVSDKVGLSAPEDADFLYTATSPSSRDDARASSFSVGESVEARRNSSFEDCDVLYYEAEVTAVHRIPRPSQWSSSSSTAVVVQEGGGATHYDLHFEDDCPQAMVPAAWVIPNTRRVVAERGHARVIAGHADTHESWMISEKGDDAKTKKTATQTQSQSKPREVLLMVFSECPTLYQSAVALKSLPPPPPPDSSSERAAGALELDHTLLPFEQHQCFALIAALAGGKERGAALAAAAAAAAGDGGLARGIRGGATTVVAPLPLSVAVLGGGGCALPTALRATFGDALDIDVLELDADVAAVAREHFGATDSPRFRLREGDAAAFLRLAPDASLDAVVLDVASTAADAGADEDDDGVVLPPEQFVSEAFLSGQLARCLARDGGVCVVNVIGGRGSLRRVAERFRRCFPPPGGAAVLCTDPNYLFWGFKGDGGWGRGGGSRRDVVEGGAAGGGGGGGGGGAPAPSEVAAAAAACPFLRALCPFALSLVRDTERHLRNQDLMGWVTVDEFIAMLADPAVIV